MIAVAHITADKEGACDAENTIEVEEKVRKMFMGKLQRR
jgi:hypothetical protein